MYYGRVSIPSASGTFTKFLGEGSASATSLKDEVGPENFRAFVILQAAWVSLLADSRLGLKPNRVINQFAVKFTANPVKTIAQMSELAHKLRKSLVVHSGVVSIDPFLVEFKDTPIFKEYLAFYRTHDVELLQYILSFLEFGKKISYNDPSLNTTALRGWIEVEQKLEGLVLPAWTSGIAAVIRIICETWSSEHMLPKHGSGAVAQKKVQGVRQKNDRFYIPLKLYNTYFREGYDAYQDYAFDTDVSPMGNSAAYDRSGLESARLFFVPKSYKTSRSICMEPIPYMWAQQAVRLWLEEMIASGILKRHVVLKDQSLNQRLSQRGSKNLRLDTIDLSSASDSVSWELVKAVFPAKILKHLLATRTHRVSIEDVFEVDVRKFAPMGSAVCFPIQSILFSSVVLYISVCQTYGLNYKDPMCLKDKDVLGMIQHCYPVRPNPRHGDLEQFAVYGDDIITDSRLTSTVIEALTDLGFSVNEDKSFTSGSAFRESCGEEYFAGGRATPFKLTLKSVDQRMQIETLAGLVDQINQAEDYGYVHCRRALIHAALYHPVEGIKCAKGHMNPILFSDDEDQTMSIRHDAPRNSHLVKRYFDLATADSQSAETHERFQRDEVRSISVGANKRRSQKLSSDNYNYVLYWRAQTGVEDPEVEENQGIPRFDTLGTGIRWRWTAI